MGYNSKKILIVGYFNASNEQASFVYVKGIRNILENLGYDVDILDKTRIQYTQFDEHVIPVKINNQIDDYLGFDKIRHFILAKDYSLVLLYDYSAYQTFRIRKLCAKRGTKVGAITTEWRSFSESSYSLISLIKWIDVDIRIRIINKYLDCNIVCSRFLENYYSKKGNCFRVPTLTDIPSTEYVSPRNVDSPIRLIYIGMPSASKENLYKFISTLIDSGFIRNIVFDLYGVTLEQFYSIFGCKGLDLGQYSNILFHGRCPQSEIRSVLPGYDYSVIYRESNQTNTAGFPTKLGESLVAGVPVLATEVGDVSLYVKEGKNGYLLPLDENGLIEFFKSNVIFHRPEVDTSALSWGLHKNNLERLSDLLDRM